MFPTHARFHWRLPSPSFSSLLHARLRTLVSVAGRAVSGDIAIGPRARILTRSLYADAYSTDDPSILRHAASSAPLQSDEFFSRIVPISPASIRALRFWSDRSRWDSGRPIASTHPCLRPSATIASDASDTGWGLFFGDRLQRHLVRFRGYHSFLCRSSLSLIFRRRSNPHQQHRGRRIVHTLPPNVSLALRYVKPGDWNAASSHSSISFPRATFTSASIPKRSPLYSAASSPRILANLHNFPRTSPPYLTHRASKASTGDHPAPNCNAWRSPSSLPSNRPTPPTPSCGARAASMSAPISCHTPPI